MCRSIRYQKRKKQRDEKICIKMPIIWMLVVPFVREQNNKKRKKKRKTKSKSAQNLANLEARTTRCNEMQRKVAHTGTRSIDNNSTWEIVILVWPTAIVVSFLFLFFCSYPHVRCTHTRHTINQSSFRGNFIYTFVRWCVCAYFFFIIIFIIIDLFLYNSCGCRVMHFLLVDAVWSMGTYSLHADDRFFCM